MLPGSARRRSPAAGALAAAALLLPAAAAAHDLWLEPAGDALVLRYGHRGGELLPLDRSRVKAFRCAAAGAARDLLAAAEFAPREVRARGRCDAASAALDAGIFTLTPDGEVNRPRSQVAQAIRAWASRQFAKWVDARAGAAAAPLGDELELVPAGDLGKARPGDKVTVRVLHRGRPAAGAVVALGHRPLGESDGSGEVRLRLRAAGLQTIGATLRRKLDSPDADAEVLEASLTFEVAP